MRRQSGWHWGLASAIGLSMLSVAAMAQVAYVGELTDGDAGETARGGVVLSNSRSLANVGALALQRVIYVNANASGDPDEDGTADHPFDGIVEAMAQAADGDTILVAPGHYAPIDAADNRLEFAGRIIYILRSVCDDFCVPIRESGQLRNVVYQVIVIIQLHGATPL